ncbi:MAG TPA: hypothetical protein VFW77_03560 [Candidatus Saccharimonadales bacterium]|nr:hypothetical protein [Candidatus Saccharimonadales bacterium]
MNPSDNKSDTNKDNDIANKDEFEQVVDKIKEANNILITVSTDPTVDQFAACIGLTLVLNKVGKHANAVFSGKVPSTIDFLKPEETLERNTDSLRDFIIALDKAKADKLRYKVENDVVKIFITPYKTSISEKDLEFSQGDLNVDVVIALGVQDKAHIDKAILSHGRILHDATVISINTARHSKLGNVNWTDNRASSLCEMVADVASELDSGVFDSQNSTALLTGIVAETDRYSNDKAAPHTMSVAGLLMSAGASMQLVTTSLSDKSKTGTIQSTDEPGAESGDGVLQIEHPKTEEEEEKSEEPAPPADEPEAEEPAGEEPPQEEEKHDDLPPPPVEPEGAAENTTDKDNSPEEDKPKAVRQRVIHEPPEFSGRLTANSEPEDGQYTGTTDPFSSNLPETPLLSRQDDKDSEDTDILFPADDGDTAKGKDLSITDLKVEGGQTLSEIEQSVSSPHLNGPDDNGSDNVSPESSTLDPNNKNTPPPPAPPPYLPPES